MARHPGGSPYASPGEQGAPAWSPARSVLRSGFPRALTPPGRTSPTTMITRSSLGSTLTFADAQLKCACLVKVRAPRQALPKSGREECGSSHLGIRERNSR